MSERPYYIGLAEPFSEVPVGETAGPNFISATNGASIPLVVYDVSASAQGGTASVDVPPLPSQISPGETVQLGSITAESEEAGSDFTVVVRIRAYYITEPDGIEEPLDDIFRNWDIIRIPGEEPGEPELPIEEPSSLDRVMVFTRTAESTGGGTETVYADIPLRTLDGIDPDALATALIPSYEDAGWLFKHIRMTTQHVETYDPRD